MAKFDWSKARYRRKDDVVLSERNWRRADRDRPGEAITIVQGANSPSNKTGHRIVRQFANLADAHKAGFTWAI